MRAIITGHSGGLGAALCDALLARGCSVLGLSRRGNPALAAHFPDSLREVAIDLADPGAIDALVG